MLERSLLPEFASTCSARNDAAPSCQSPRRFVAALIERDGLWLALLIAAYFVAMAIAGLERDYIGLHENDFIKFFIPEATRLLEGQPLQSEWHPPLYAIVLAGTYQIFGDWLVAGVFLSLLASLVALAASYFLFLQLAGKPAAWGAVLALLGSAVFVGESIRASSDALFLALFLCACLLAVLAHRSQSRLVWCLCGVVVGLSLLLRSNAPPLIVLCLAPLGFPGKAAARLGNCLSALGGLAVPILGMTLFAVVSGSALLPSSNHINLAASYFASGTDRASTDAALDVAGRFDNLAQVIAHDPITMAKTYLLDLYRLASTNVVKLMEMPLPLLFLPGVFFLFGGHASRVGLLIVLVMALELLMLNLKPFEDRYYLFLIPLMGAAVGEMCWRMLLFARTSAFGKGLVSALVCIFPLACGLAIAKTLHITRSNVIEISQVLPTAREILNHRSKLVARKLNLSFYTGAQSLFMPDLATVDDLEKYLSDQAAGGDLYVYFGRMERQYRPQYEALARSADAPGWLETIAASDPPGQWALYRYRNLPIEGGATP